MVSPVTTAELIHHHRTRQDMTREQLAVAAGVSLPTIQRAEAGNNDPALSTLRAIATALGVPVAALLGTELPYSEPTESKVGGKSAQVSECGTDEDGRPMIHTIEAV